MIRYEPRDPVYYEDLHKIEDGFDAQTPQILKMNGYVFNEKEKNNTDFFIDGFTRKVVVRFESSFFHAFFHTLGPILYEHSKDPGVEIILLQSSKEKDAFSTSGNFITKVLRDLKIKYTVVQTHSVYPPVLNNFYYYENVELCGAYIKCLNDVINKYRDISKENNKKIYITRGKRENLSVTQVHLMTEEEKKNLPFLDDLRIDNEDELEDLLRNNGFEIVNGETFTELEDQIRFFDQAKVIVALSGSGLTNSLFLRDGATVIELTTTQLVKKNIEFHYHFYLIATIFTDKIYISIPNVSRKFDKIKNEIERMLKIL